MVSRKVVKSKVKSRKSKVERLCILWTTVSWKVLATNARIIEIQWLNPEASEPKSSKVPPKNFFRPLDLAGPDPLGETSVKKHKLFETVR